MLRPAGSNDTDLRGGEDRLSKTGALDTTRALFQRCGITSQQPASATNNQPKQNRQQPPVGAGQKAVGDLLGDLTSQNANRPLLVEGPTIRVCQTDAVGQQAANNSRPEALCCPDLRLAAPRTLPVGRG
jgi:hypothetical protein